MWPAAGTEKNIPDPDVTENPRVVANHPDVTENPRVVANHRDVTENQNPQDSALKRIVKNHHFTLQKLVNKNPKQVIFSRKMDF
jgi:hypothetical protein